MRPDAWQTLEGRGNMSNPGNISDETITLDLNSLDMRLVARRQLIGAMLALILISLAGGLTTLRPAYRNAATVALHRIALIQQPIFADQAAQRIASAKPHDIELP
jgi:hypothetical protein